jgi:hypothetical protein
MDHTRKANPHISMISPVAAADDGMIGSGSRRSTRGRPYASPLAAFCETRVTIERNRIGWKRPTD